MRLRFSIARLMALVLLVSVGLAAARAGAFTFAIVTLSAMTIGALLSRGLSRQFFLGCTVCGWAFMLLAFATGGQIRFALPTTHLIIRIYELIDGPGPTTFKSPEEAERVIMETVEAGRRAITIGHSLISLGLALAGGIIMWLFAIWRKNRAQRSGNSSSIGGHVG